MSRLFLKNQLLKQKIQEWFPRLGVYSTSIDGFIIARRDFPSDFEKYFYKPMVILILQGSKHAILGSKEYRYTENQYMISTVDLPATSRIVEASPEKPCLAIALEHNPMLISQLLVEVTDNLKEKNIDYPGFAVEDTTLLLLDAFLRLTLLLKQPEKDQKVLSEMLKREIHYLLLMSPVGKQLQAFASQETRYNKIAKAVRIH